VFSCREEDQCRERELQLREKDTLIQDNLIRFSTFLQQQEQRKKYDEEARKQELQVSYRNFLCVGRN
jgi:hypothetical protein